MLSNEPYSLDVAFTPLMPQLKAITEWGVKGVSAAASVARDKFEQSAFCTTPDKQEGWRAYLEKRPPAGGNEAGKAREPGAVFSAAFSGLVLSAATIFPVQLLWLTPKTSRYMTPITETIMG